MENDGGLGAQAEKVWLIDLDMVLTWAILLAADFATRPPCRCGDSNLTNRPVFLDKMKLFVPCIIFILHKSV